MSIYPEHKLLDSQRKAVYDVIEAAGFDPSNFSWSTTHGQVFGNTVPTLIHKVSGADFVFDFDPQYGAHIVEWSPGEQRPRDKTGAGPEEGFGLILRCVNIWLDNIRRELSTPDLWALIEEQREELSASLPPGDTDDTPFTPEEQAQISRQLEEIKQLLVNNYGADPAALEGRIEELEEAAKRSGRRGWYLMLMGVFFTWTLEGLVPPEGLRVALRLAAQGIGHLFGGTPQLPTP